MSVQTDFTTLFGLCEHLGCGVSGVQCCTPAPSAGLF
jgi:hypothetical protein